MSWGMFDCIHKPCINPDGCTWVTCNERCKWYEKIELTESTDEQIQ